MSNKAKTLLVLCSISILFILFIQFYWLKQFYLLSKKDYETKVNTYFDQAIKAEFDSRLDSLTKLISDALMDTSEYQVSSEFDKTESKLFFKIASKKDAQSAIRFTSFEQTLPLKANDSNYKRKIVSEYARRIRDEDLKNHFVIYRLKNLGAFLDLKVKEYSFDTSRLKRILRSTLDANGINTEFIIATKYLDSLPDLSPINTDRSYISTSWHSTFKWWSKDEKYVQAIFKNPDKYLLSKMTAGIILSVVLLVLTGIVAFILFNAWRKEKQLAVIKDDFINNITHELKTPLASVSAAIEALSDFDVLKDPEKAKRYLKLSGKEITRLHDVINAILDLSISENGKTLPPPKEIQVKQRIESLTQALVESAVPKAVVIDSSQCEDGFFIRFDTAGFDQIINNLVQNSIKYSGNSVSIQITTKVDRVGKKIIIADNGWGIGKEDLPFVLDKFFRGSSHRTMVNGHGLGLHYVRTLMESNGGKIEINSAQNKGTIITLVWP